jgi:hypothetical protein
MSILKHYIYTQYTNTYILCVYYSILYRHNIDSVCICTDALHRHTIVNASTACNILSISIPSRLYAAALLTDDGRMVLPPILQSIQLCAVVHRPSYGDCGQCS